MDITKLDILKNKANLISAKELCERLNICESTLWYYRKSGLSYIKIGGRIYFDLDDVADYMMRKETTEHSKQPEDRRGDLNEN